MLYLLALVILVSNILVNCKVVSWTRFMLVTVPIITFLFVKMLIY